MNRQNTHATARLAFLLSAAAATVGCLSCTDLPAVGDEGQPCSDKGKCRKGLLCDQNRICSKPGTVHEPDAGGSDAATDATVLPDASDASPDASDTGLHDAEADAPSDDASDASELSDTSDAGADAGLADATGDAADASDLPDASDVGTPDTGSPDTGCTPQCVGKCSGPDTCGGTCPDNCVAPDTCGGGGTQNVCGCTADCTGKCGGLSDGCVGTCTSCPDWYDCKGNGCVTCGRIGEVCCQGSLCDAGMHCYQNSCVADACNGKSDFTPCELVTDPDFSFDVCVRDACVSPGCGTIACNTPGPHFPMPDTSQKKCFNESGEVTCPTSGGVTPCAYNGTPAFCGQDAQYGWDTKHLPAERFAVVKQVAGQPIVIDNVTRLVWQRCEAGISGGDCEVPAYQTKNWVDALKYCDGSTWGGFTDWRLPDRHELQSIVDYDGGPIAVDTDAFPVTAPEAFWTATGDENTSRGSWSILEPETHHLGTKMGCST
ncbi:MAG: DUF1566 domain-containing protein [Deltaproteobacteria bacterium]|nr:DUF1566 domain-containing protein [Deltaproteobacteria bacterium]